MLFFHLHSLIFFGHVAAIPGPRPIKGDIYPGFLSTPMKRVHQSTSKYIWGKCLKSLFRQHKNAVHQVLVKKKNSLLKPGFKQPRFIAFLKLLGGKAPVVNFPTSRRTIERYFSVSDKKMK